MDGFIEWAGLLFGGGSFGYLLINRFFRTPEQKGSDAADMVRKTAEAFKETLETVSEYNKGVIESMRTNSESLTKDYNDLRERFSKMEKKLERNENERELMEHIISGANGCPFLVNRDNNRCPVIKENRERVVAKCKECLENK